MSTLRPTRLSHVALAARDADQLTACCEFYLKLGFKAIEQDENQAWLQLFTADERNQLTLRIFIKPEVPVLSESEVDAEAIPRIVLACENIESAKESLTTNEIPFECIEGTEPTLADHLLASKLDDATDLADMAREILIVRDPLGTVVYLTDRPHPLFKINAQAPFMVGSTSGAGRLDAAVAALHHGLKLPESILGRSSNRNGVRPMNGITKRIGVLTSGGDAPGMNAAVRAVVRMAIAKGCQPYGIIDGYQGLVDGGEKIRPFSWNDVRGYLSVGGTLIGTARCQAFRERDGRRTAALNLVRNGIDALVVIGGDGSLTGADTFRKEWPELLAELQEMGEIDEEQVQRHQHLTVVGLVGSIDNDMTSTDLTIGAITCLHRICEAVDSIASTATSHSRAFVIEVMGRHCGWLAMMAAVATGANYVFVPERPPAAGWEERMCEAMKLSRKLGKRKLIIIVAEGAIDQDLNPIKPSYVRQVLADAGFDTRVTTLGHVQRGGTPCAFDRVLATIQGVEAVNAVLSATPDTPSPMIGLSENNITRFPLMEAVKLTHEVAAAIAEKDFGRAMELRDPEFARTYDVFQAISLNSDIPSAISAGVVAEDPAPIDTTSKPGLRIGIVHVGAPAAGFNAATRVAVRFALKQGHQPLAIYNGFPGLMRGEVKEFTWMSVDGWQVKGGSELGTNRFQPDEDFGRVAYQMQRFDINALMIVGGFEAFTALCALASQRDKYPAFCIPMVHLPATLSNNVPGTDYSIGCDTSLNVIAESCDRIKQSATASRRRVFVVETQGGRCGYLATMAGLAAGATCVYTPEKGISLADLQSDVQHLIRLYSQPGNKGRQGTIVLRTEGASKTYTTEVIAAIFKEEAHKLFDARTAALGHLQQGGTPSPLDRIRASNLAVRCIDWLARMAVERTPADSPYRVYTTEDDTATVIGIRGAHIVFSPVQQLRLNETDVKNRRPIKQWWSPLTKLLRVFAKYGIVEGEAAEPQSTKLWSQNQSHDDPEDVPQAETEITIQLPEDIKDEVATPHASDDEN